MLVLSRERDESIMIGDDIVVTVVDVRGDKVRLGINAPPEVPVHRIEVYQAIVREHANALLKEFGQYGIRQEQCEAAVKAARLNYQLAREVMTEYVLEQKGKQVAPDGPPTPPRS